MKARTGRRFDSHAMTLTEVLVVIAVLVVLASSLLPAGSNRKLAIAMRIGCASNLKQAGLAYRLWAGDNNDRFPMQVSATNRGEMELALSGNVFPIFQVMSNGMNTPRLLVCPADKGRVAATNWSELRRSNISYFVSLDTDETRPQMFLSGDSNLEVDQKPVGPGILSLSSNTTVGWTAARHPRRSGNILLADGSVQQADEKILRHLLEESGVATNRLAMP
jgi:prepilin-type N-terminal cleavage/methylation domain-containing protein/prepilin-type processing-associated H-X9-DG protein